MLGLLQKGPLPSIFSVQSALQATLEFSQKSTSPNIPNIPKKSRLETHRAGFDQEQGPAIAQAQDFPRRQMSPLGLV